MYSDPNVYNIHVFRKGDKLNLTIAEVDRNADIDPKSEIKDKK